MYALYTNWQFWVPKRGCLTIKICLIFYPLQEAFASASKIVLSTR